MCLKLRMCSSALLDMDGLGHMSKSFAELGPECQSHQSSTLCCAAVESVSWSTDVRHAGDTRSCCMHGFSVLCQQLLNGTVTSALCLVPSWDLEAHVELCI